MKRRLTTIINILVIGMFTYLVPFSLYSQDPVQLSEISTANSVMGPMFSYTDCNTAPVISCPSIYFGCPGDIVTPDITGFATAVPGDEFCEIPVVTYVDDIISEGPCNGAMEIHRIWTAVYPNNSNPYLYAECTQLILLADTQGPTIFGCPNDIEVVPEANCEAIVIWSEPTATDQCALLSLTSDYNSGDSFSLGTTTVTYTATDSCGNTNTCSFDVVVSGSCCFDAPTLTCPSDYLGCPTDGVDISVTGNATAIGGDQCEEPVITFTDNIISTGPCTGAQVIERTWLATYPDDESLSATCIQNITLGDTKVPLITNAPLDMTVSPGNDCNAIATWNTPVATDNCSIPTLHVNIPSGSTFEEGQTIVTYTATDDCGNQAFHSFTVTVSSCCNTPPTIICPEDYTSCPGTDISINSQGYCESTPSEYTGWAVATCNADANTDDPVGVIYNISNTTTAPQGEDWAPSITDIHPSNWTLGQIGQIFGIAIGNNDDVYLAASDIYDTQYDSDPYGPGQIFKAESDNDFLAVPFVELPNSGGALNGIGNIAYDNTYHQLFASNLEDGKIYQISSDGTIVDTFDPWSSDTGNVGIVPSEERVWGIGLNIENGLQKIYFARISGNTREMYSITLDDGAFPYNGSEVLEFDNIIGVGKRISDIAFSDDGTQMIFSERGTKFTTGAHDAKMLKYSLDPNGWSMDLQYYVGSWVTEQYPSIVVDPGENSAGGVAFGPTIVNDEIEGCDQMAWVTMNYFETENGNLYYGMQGIDASGNNPSNADADPNTETDIIIDFDGTYDNFVQKGDLGDVEIFYNSGALSGNNTGLATAISGGVGCGQPFITFEDNIISEGPCEGAVVVERVWTATDVDNNDLSSSCTQVITLEDNSNPIFSSFPNDITLAPNDDCSAIATWSTPTVTDNCGVDNITASHPSGSSFDEGTTTVVYTATDNCGNAVNASFTVTVTECCTQLPILNCAEDFIGCPSSSLNPNTTGYSVAIAGSENCATPILSFSDNVTSTGPCNGEKTIVRTWMAIDPDNNSLFTSCQQSIILKDDVAPEIFGCPEDITISTTGNTAIVQWTEPTATDDCGLEWIMADYVPGDEFPIGNTIVTYTAVDDCENVTPCTFIITVEQEGTLTCPDDIVVSCDGTDETFVTWDLPTLETGCADCGEGDSIPGFVFMGSLDGSLYYCSTSPAASHSAKSISASNGGHLAVINSEEENNLLSGFLNTQCALMGLSDNLQEGNYAWTNGEAVQYTNWAEGQPNNANGNQDCAVICTDGWYDAHCEIAYEFIMEIPCNTYNQTSGLPNGSSFPIGTDTISYVVTDACGSSFECSFTVTVEGGASLECPEDHTFQCPAGQSSVIAHWSTPELSSCCNDCNSGPAIDGYMYMGNYNGSNYYCSMGNASWPQANALAQSHGGYLAEVNDAGENAFLANILTLQRAWIGLNDQANEGHFQWSNGNSLTYSNWYPGQPNNNKNYQDYVSMLNDGQWNDEYNNLAMEYIMEVPCNSVTQIGGPASGSILSVGTTTITYAGMDGCGNTDTCSFDITILSPDTSCPSYAQDSWYMWIESFGLGDFENISGNNGGYEDFTDGECIEITAGDYYPITLNPGFVNSLYTVYWKVWIDYNQDGDYLDAGEYVAYGSGYQELTGTLPISNNCLLGQTTMRVAMKYGAYPSGPCAIFSQGEVEDYCVNISGGSSISEDSSNKDATLLQQDDYSQAFRLSTELPIHEHNSVNIRSDIDKKFNVYPNPTSDILNIILDTDDNVAFEIYDSAGSKVLTKSINFSNGQAKLNLSELNNGVYFLRSSNGHYSKKVFIQR